MSLVDDDTYSSAVPIPTGFGNLSYWIRAVDLTGHQSQSNVSWIEYFDGLGPIVVIVIPDLTSLFDAQGSSSVTVNANITDDSSVIDSLLSFRYEETGEWIEQSMNFDLNIGLYVSMIPLISKNGTVYFMIRATDGTMITSESEIFVLNYHNANPSTDSLVPLIAILSIGGIALVGLTFVVLRRMGKIPQSILDRMGNFRRRFSRKKDTNQ
ncbi:MAG: hypothetical protein IH840_13655 [Candidatus Heimdallarchaeota archaeon]|nr:hypothetical protein [Candidatus Heimdallarchaeota archaeon]